MASSNNNTFGFSPSSSSVLHLCHHIMMEPSGFVYYSTYSCLLPKRFNVFFYFINLDFLHICLPCSETVTTFSLSLHICNHCGHHLKLYDTILDCNDFLVSNMLSKKSERPTTCRAMHFDFKTTILNSLIPINFTLQNSRKPTQMGKR